MKRLFVLLVCLGTLLYALPSGIESVIKRSGIPTKDLSIYIKEAGKSDRIIASLNASAIRKPASVIKVFTTYAALLKLGFDYRWPTQFYRTGTLRNGTLHGDLIIKGFGDPTLDAKDLDEIVSRIKAAGVRKVTGNIVIDRSYFRVGNRNSAKFDENPHSPYNAMPDAMMFNERVSTICVIPNQNSVTKKHPDGSYVVHNNLKRVNKPCRGRYSWPRVKIDDTKAVPEVWLSGTISKRCGKRNICKVLTQPYKSFYYAFKGALAQAGVKVHGTMRLGKVPGNARIIFTHYSDPLEKIVSKTAKKSNNLYARHLLLLLGAKVYGAPVTVEKGRRAVVQILRQHGALGTEKVILDNGSGLSRKSRLTAKALADVLDDAYARYGMRWMRTLSIAGVDGTIKRRFRGTVVRNRAWMKTGTLKRVKNIAGYVKSRNGRYYTVVILVNTNRGRWKAAKLENDIIKWLVEQKRTFKQTQPKHSSSPKSVSVPTGKMYYIQAGSFAQPPKKDLLQKIDRTGLPYKTVYEDQYKVLIGPFDTERHAREVLHRVRTEVMPNAFLLR